MNSIEIKVEKGILFQKKSNPPFFYKKSLQITSFYLTFLKAFR